MSKTKRHDPLRLSQRDIDAELVALEMRWGEAISVMRAQNAISAAWRRYQALPSDARWARLDDAITLARTLVVDGSWEYDDV